MRKITSKKESQKKDKRKQLIVGLILIFIMLASTLGYSFSRFASKSDEEIEYNGFTFTKQNGFWNTEINGLPFYFSYSPKEISVDSNVLLTLNSYSGQPLYINSENTDSEYEIYRNLDSVVLRRQYACLGGMECDENFPIKTCDDNFILIRESETNKISLDKNCVFIEGTKEELVKVTDGFLFKILGVQ